MWSPLALLFFVFAVPFVGYYALGFFVAHKDPKALRHLADMHPLRRLPWSMPWSNRGRPRSE